MKIVGICGSPRHYGNSEWALNFLLKKSSEFADVKYIILSEKVVAFCNGCLICEDNLPCHHNDDMAEINNCLLDADAIVVSTPVYFDNVPAILKNLIDRTNPICNNMKGKKAVVITFGQADNASWDSATQYLNAYFDILGIQMIGCYSFGARNLNDAENNDKIEKQLDKIVLELRKLVAYGQ